MTVDMPAFLTRLVQATNAHDLDALVDCFGPEYRNETPVHPGRDFAGREQVRANWSQIFSFVPDVHVSVQRWAQDGPDVWSEWEMRGQRRDGTAHLMRGVIIFGVLDGQARWARFYLEPVQDAQDTVNDAVAAQVHASAPSVIETT
jgi:ketosteroid isomerase-like protein